MTPLPTPQQLRYLLALAEHAHFGRAAEACAVTQSTLSAGILALERQLDARILDRDGGKRVVFTPLGRELLGRAREAMAALAAVVEAADAARAPMSGPLRLGVIPTVGAFLLPRLMPALRAAFPLLRLYLREDTTERLLDRLAGGQLDVALLALPCDCLGAASLAVVRDPFLAALPAGHPLAALAEVPAIALANERLLLLEDGHCLREQALAACGYSGALGGALRASSLPTLLNMVAAGYGTTLIPGLAAGAAQDAGIVLRPLAARAGRTVRIAWRAHFSRRAAVEAVGEVIATRLHGFAAGAAAGTV